MPTQQQNQGEDAAVRSAPDRPRRSVVARVLSACVRLWTPNPADDPLCPSSPALDNVDQLPGPSSGPTESSSSPLRRDDKKEDQVTAERLQQEERHILTQPPPTFPALGTGRTSLSREQSVKNSVIRKTSTASEFSCSPTEQGKAAPDQLFSREGSSKVDEELGKAGAGSASETDGSHHKRFASPASGKISAPDDTAGVIAAVATENPHCATAENTLETCQKCRPIWMSPAELDALASIDESGGVPTRMEAKVRQEVPQRPSSLRIASEPASRFSSVGSSKSAATQKPEAATKEEALPKKIPREHAVRGSREIVTREYGTTLAKKAMITDIKAKYADEAPDLMLRLSQVFTESNAACRPRTEGEKGEDTLTFLARMVDVFADETNQAHGPVSDASSRLPDEHSLRSHRPASSELGESAAIAEAAAAAASAAAVMKTYDHASPQPGEKPGDEIDKKTRKPFDMERVEQTRPKSKQGEARALGTSEKVRTATAAAASRASTSRAWPGPLKQHSSKQRTEPEGKHFSGVPQEQKPGAVKASAPSSGTVADGRHSTAGPAAAAAPSGTPAAPRFCTFGSFPASVDIAITPVPTAYSFPTAAASSAKAQHQPDVATASSSSSDTIRLRPVTESSGGWKWPTAAASAADPSERNLGGKAVGGSAVSAVKVDKPPFESFKWMGRASTPKAKLPWGSWKRKRDPEAWEKMVSTAILNSVASRQEKGKHSA